MSILLYKPDQVFQTFLNVPGVYLYDPNNEIGIFDKIVFGKYWHLSSMLSILDKDFLSAQQNLNFEEEAEFLMTPELANLLQLPNSLVVFYNEYETADFISKVDLVARQICFKIVNRSSSAISTVNTQLLRLGFSGIISIP